MSGKKGVKKGALKAMHKEEKRRTTRKIEYCRRKAANTDLFKRKWFTVVEGRKRGEKETQRRKAEEATPRFVSDVK